MKSRRLTCWLVVVAAVGAGIMIGVIVDQRSIPPGAGATAARGEADDYPAFRGADGLAVVRGAKLAAD